MTAHRSACHLSLPAHPAAAARPAQPADGAGAAGRGHAGPQSQSQRWSAQPCPPCHLWRCAWRAAAQPQPALQRRQWAAGRQPLPALFLPGKLGAQRQPSLPCWCARWAGQVSVAMGGSLGQGHRVSAAYALLRNTIHPPRLQATLHSATSSSRPAPQQHCVQAAAAQGAWRACLAAPAACLRMAARPSRATAQQLQRCLWERQPTTCSSTQFGRTSRVRLGGRARPPPTRCAAATPPLPARRWVAGAAEQARPGMRAWRPAAPGPPPQGHPRWSSRRLGALARAAPTHLAALCRPTAHRGARSGSRCRQCSSV